MKFQILFSGKIKKNVSKCLLKFLPSMLSVKNNETNLLKSVMNKVKITLKLISETVN